MIEEQGKEITSRLEQLKELILTELEKLGRANPAMREKIAQLWAVWEVLVRRVIRKLAPFSYEDSMTILMMLSSRLINSLAALIDHPNPIAFLTTALNWTVIDFQREQRRRERRYLLARDDEEWERNEAEWVAENCTPTLDEEYIAKEEHQRLIQALDKLSPSDREYYQYRVEEGLTHEFIAGMLGIEPSAARKRGARMLRRLEELLEENDA